MVELMSNENKKKKFGLKIFSSKSGKVIKCDFYEKRKDSHIQLDRRTQLQLQNSLSLWKRG